MHVFLLGKSAPFVAEVGFFAALISESSLSLLFFFLPIHRFKWDGGQQGGGEPKDRGSFPTAALFVSQKGGRTPPLSVGVHCSCPWFKRVGGTALLLSFGSVCTQNNTAVQNEVSSAQIRGCCGGVTPLAAVLVSFAVLLWTYSRGHPTPAGSAVLRALLTRVP